MDNLINLYRNMTEFHKRQMEAFDFMVKQQLWVSNCNLHKPTSDTKDPESEKEELKQIIIDNFYALDLSKYCWCSDEEQVRVDNFDYNHYNVMNFLSKFLSLPKLILDIIRGDAQFIKDVYLKYHSIMYFSTYESPIIR